VKTHVLIVGPLPPPMHGSARVTREMSQRIGESCRTRVCDTNAQPGTGLAYHLTRIRSYVLAAWVMVTMTRPGRRRVLYIGGSGGLGLWYEVVLVALARLLGWRIAFHHHSYRYLRQPRRAMAAFVRASGPRALHLVLCAGMRDRLRDLYPTASNAIVLSNAIFVGIEPGAGERRDGPGETTRPLRFSHVSNLSFGKGLDVVLQSVDACLEAGLDVELDLAGPVSGDEEKQLLQSHLERHGSRIHHVGPIANDEVVAFLARSDYFLFPSRYKHEAEPLVVLEAMAAGVPALMTDVGCARALAVAGLPPLPDAETFRTSVVSLARDGREGTQLDELRRQTSDHLIELQGQSTAALADFRAWLEG
jgi:glycosyltransferase involved in cell wall biosynthesis